MSAGTGIGRGIGEARTFLFVPGDRPDRFAKAAAAGADVVVLDLEDAVAPAAKADARAAVRDALRDLRLPAGTSLAVRVNPLGSPWHYDDLGALATNADTETDTETAIMLPKADAAAVASLSGDRPVIALVETAQGVLDAATIARSAAVHRLALGHLDLAADLKVAPTAHTVVDHARVTLVVAAAAAGQLGPVDGVTPQVRDADQLTADLAHAVEVGCAGKLCIHPTQVAAAQAAFAPDPEEVRWAERVLAAHEAADGDAVLVVDGQMVDAPVLARARFVTRAATPHPTSEGDHS